MKRIIVTGAGGLVGYAASRHFEEKGYDTVSLVNHKVPEGLRHVVRKDLQKESLEDLGDVDVVFHCAAALPGKEIQNDKIAAVNRAIDDNVIHYCRKHSKKLVYVSGTTLYGFQDQAKIYSEEDPIVSLPAFAGYLDEKAETERAILGSGIPSAILRVSSPYGFMQSTRNVLKIFMDKVFAGEDLSYYGKGERTQNFIEATDVARAAEKACKQSETEIYNIASDQPVSMKELAETVARLATERYGRNINAFSTGEDPQESFRANISIEKAKRQLGWRPEISLSQGILRWMEEREFTLSKGGNRCIKTEHAF